MLIRPRAVRTIVGPMPNAARRVPDEVRDERAPIAGNPYLDRTLTELVEEAEELLP